MQPVLPGRQACVAAVHRQRVLSQIVGADREKIDVRSQLVGHERGRWNLDHDAQLDGRHAQFPPLLLHQFPGLLQLADVADHGKHDLQIAIRRSPQNRAQLFAEQVQMGQAKTDAALSQKRVCFRTHVNIGQGLIPAYIQGADDDWQRSHGFGKTAIETELLVLGGRHAAIQK